MPEQRKSRKHAGFTIGELLLVFGAIILLTGAFTPFIKYSNERMARVDCSNNLRRIGLAMYIYARENQGKFPPSIETLFDEQYLGDARVLDCPASRTSGTRKDPDYIYTPGLSVYDESATVLVRDKPGNHHHGSNVLYVDGTIMWEERI